MGNGMLAQQRRGLAVRALAGAILLAVPVVVAAAIGFSSGISGLTSALQAGLNGPEGEQSSAGISSVQGQGSSRIVAIGSDGATAGGRAGGRHLGGAGHSGGVNRVSDLGGGARTGGGGGGSAAPGPLGGQN